MMMVSLNGLYEEVALLKARVKVLEYASKKDNSMDELEVKGLLTDNYLLKEANEILQEDVNSYVKELIELRTKVNNLTTIIENSNKSIWQIIKDLFRFK